MSWQVFMAIMYLDSMATRAQPCSFVGGTVMEYRHRGVPGYVRCSC